MEYRKLGRSGLLVSELAYGSWVTFGEQMDVALVRECMKTAFDSGVNFFDNAEGYAEGQSETLMGKVLREFPRSEVVVSTKLFWGGKKPNQTGLSRKHLMEGINASLKRLQLDYVDLLYCHRPDPNTPMEEIVTTMNIIIQQGKAFYWGTSEWSEAEIEQAFSTARQLNLIPPTMEQPQYNMFTRDKMEREFLPLFEKYGLGTTIWSPLASGLLTGKYKNGIPRGSRLEKLPWLREIVEKNKLLSPESHDRMETLKQIAQSLSFTLSQLAIAWCLKNERVSTVILGASNANQLRENLRSAEAFKKLDQALYDTINQVIAGWRNS